MTTHRDIAERWAKVAASGEGRLLRPYSTNIIARGDAIYSYGNHFCMAEYYPSKGLFLINGDRYSPSTTRHQQYVRDAIAKTGKRSIILPFSVLREAGIDRASVDPIDVVEDRVVREWHPAVGDVARVAPATRGYDAANNYVHVNEAGEWGYETWRHVLGESLFFASGTVDGRQCVNMRFLSGWDAQERTPLYFLCELPPNAWAKTVAEAYETLKPRHVQAVATYEKDRDIVRQGDIFAVESSGPCMVGTGPKREKRGRLLGTNHEATETAVDFYGDTYARGCLYHAPIGRKADHARRKLGDGKTWYRIFKNTVPAGRSWSVANGYAYLD